MLEGYVQKSGFATIAIEAITIIVKKNFVDGLPVSAGNGPERLHILFDLREPAFGIVDVLIQCAADQVIHVVA